MAIQWKDVNVNFNDVNSAMANAQSGISNAGTVFGELRKAILNEEQKAIDNAHRQKVFDENVRQFGLQHALNQDKLAEQIRANQANEANIRRGQDLSNKAAMASIGVQNARLAFDRSKWNTQQEQLNRDREILANIYKGVAEEQNTVNNSIKQLEKELDSTTDPVKKTNLQNQLNGLKVQRNQLSASALDQTVRTEAAKYGIYLKDTAFTDAAKSEEKRVDKAREVSLKNKEAHTKNIAEASKAIKELNLTVGQQDKATRALARAMELYPNTPPTVLASAITDLPTYNAWWDWDAKNALEVDNSINIFGNTPLDDFVQGRDLENNGLNKMFASKALLYERNKNK